MAKVFGQAFFKKLVGVGKVHGFNYLSTAWSIFILYHFIFSSDDHETVEIWGNAVKNFSGRGPTAECIIKPDIIAPGSNIVSCLSCTKHHASKNHEIVDENYVKLSGTSMSTPIVSGAIALLLEKYPWLEPDDVKYMLKTTATLLNYAPNQQGWGMLDIERLLSGEAVHVRQ